MRVPDDAEGPLPTLPTLPPLLQLANRLEQAWHATSSSLPPPRLDDFLPPSGDPTRPAALLELIRVDLEIRWQRGLPALLESYIQQFPELGEMSSLPAELIYHEFRVRRQHGDRPALPHYQKRFPSQYRRLLLVAKGEASRGAAGDRSSSSKTPHPPGPLVSKVETSSREGATHAPPASGKKTGELLVPPSAPPPSDNRTVVPMVGGYRLLNRLGEGALGEVWKAEAPGGVEVAVKRLSRTLAAQEAQCELQSLEHVKRIRHNYLTQIHAFWILKSRLYVVMELADSSLSDHAEHCRSQGLPGIPQEDLLRYMREAGEALDFLHAEGVHHRDIKPANILLLKGHVKVADFGLVRPLQDTQSVVNATFCGTPTYMAPEVWENKFSVHSDQWSLAVSYVELRLNRRVFKSRTIPSLMTEIRTGQVDLSPLPPAEQRVLRRALHLNPRQRYPSCTAFAQALEAVFHPPAAPPRRRWLPTLVTLLICLAAGGLLVSLFFFFWNPPPAVPRPARIHSQETPKVQVDTGRERTFRLPLVRENYEGAIHLVPERELPNIAIEAKAGEGEAFADVTVRVGPKAELRIHRIRLLPTEEHLEGALAFDVTILYLPADFKAVGPEIEEDDHNIQYHKRIYRPLNDNSSVEFVLVPQKKDSWKASAGLRDPSTFYISRFKISREQFQFFAEKNPKVDGRWREHANGDRMPVRDVTVTDAHTFADWLGGRLPSLMQWDKAAGRYHPHRGHDPYWEGPYKGKWDPKRRLRIAVGLEMPLSLGSPQTEDDESVYGCRDMAGNGSEWTRSMPGREEVPLQRAVKESEDRVYLRGWSFDNAEPLTFERLDKDELLREDRAEQYKGTSPTLGFRVVLEPKD